MLTLHSTTNHESSISKPEAFGKTLEHNQGDLHKCSSISTFEYHKLSASRITDYIKDPDTSHVGIQHVTPQESFRILAKKKSYIHNLNDVLSNNKK
jgi:hypothetical protein